MQQGLPAGESRREKFFDIFYAQRLFRHEAWL
jgi:hypothetical protein